MKEKRKPGRRNTDSEKARAQELFVSTDLTQGRIAAIVGVAEKTMSDWVNADNEAWKQLRAANGITKGSIISMLLLQLSRLLDSINARPTGGNFPNSNEADTISKLAGQIEKLEKKNNLAAYIQVMDEFVEYLNKREPKLAKELSTHLLDFAKEKSKNLNG